LLKYLRRRAGLTQRELSIARGIQRVADRGWSRASASRMAPSAGAAGAGAAPGKRAGWAARLLELGGVARAGLRHGRDASAPAAPPPNNLPLQLTSFIGREKVLADVERLLLGEADSPAARLVTLTGHGGCGKTRLAIQAGAAQLPGIQRWVCWWSMRRAGLKWPAAFCRSRHAR